MRVIKYGQKIEYCKTCNSVSVIKKGPNVQGYQQAIVILISIVALLSLELVKLHI